MDDLPKIRIDTDSHQAWLGDKVLPTTRMEFALLAYLTERAGALVTRGAILRDVWNIDWGPRSAGKSLDMHVSLLRRKLSDNPAKPRYIATVRGVGFRMEAGAVELVAPQSGPDQSMTRVMLIKAGDVLVLSGCGEVSERVAATAAALRDQLGLAGILLVPGDVDMTALPGGAIYG